MLDLPARPGRPAPPALPTVLRRIATLERQAGIVPGLAPLPAFGPASRAVGEVAAALSLSPRTVQRHVANVYLKIDAHNRAEATAYALGHGLA